MNTLAAHFTLPLPDHWSPDQALVVYQLLSDLAETIWNRYEIPLIELLTSELEQNNSSQLDLFDFNDPIPF
jgi:hypothetical protein